MNTLYLHVGPHKTGTTAIQKFFLDNQQFLLKFNIFYPKRFQRVFGHHDFRELLLDNSMTQEDINFFDNQAHDFLLSSEDFISLGSPSFEHLRSSLRSTKIVPIYAWRRASHKLYSIWQEVIKHGGTIDFFSYYHDHLAHPAQSQMLSADLKLNIFCHVFGKDNVRVLDYDASLRNSRLLKDFLQIIGVAWNDAFVTAENNPNSINRSMSIADIEIIRALNHIFKSRFDIHGDFVRTHYIQQTEALTQAGLNKLKMIVGAYEQVITVGNYFIDIRCEKIMLDKFRDNLINYEPSTTVSELKIAQPDWIFDTEAQSILNELTNVLQIKQKKQELKSSIMSNLTQIFRKKRA